MTPSAAISPNNSVLPVTATKIPPRHDLHQRRQHANDHAGAVRGVAGRLEPVGRRPDHHLADAVIGEHTDYFEAGDRDRSRAEFDRSQQSRQRHRSDQAGKLRCSFGDRVPADVADQAVAEQRAQAAL